MLLKHRCPKLISVYLKRYGFDVNNEELRLAGDERGITFTESDEHANNEKPYNWKVDGPGSYFGQHVTHWMPIPDSPDAFN